MQGTAGQSASPHSQEGYEANLHGSHFQACDNVLYINLDNSRERNLSGSSDDNKLGVNE